MRKFLKKVEKVKNLIDGKKFIWLTKTFSQWCDEGGGGVADIRLLPSQL